MDLSRILTIAVLVFPVSELALAFLKRARVESAVNEDQGSLWVLWLVIGGSVGAAFLLGRQPGTVLPLSVHLRLAVALGFLAGGLALRWVAILTLGRFFTVDVAVHRQHHLVRSGLYRYMRHPSYTGLLAAFLGLGIYIGTWLSVGLIMVPITVAIFYRIGREEAVLRALFGEEYETYAAHTRRLLPWLI